MFAYENQLYQVSEKVKRQLLIICLDHTSAYFRFNLKIIYSLRERFKLDQIIANILTFNFRSTLTYSMCRLNNMCHYPPKTNMTGTDISLKVLFKAYVLLNHLFHDD